MSTVTAGWHFRKILGMGIPGSSGTCFSIADVNYVVAGMFPVERSTYQAIVIEYTCKRLPAILLFCFPVRYTLLFFVFRGAMLSTPRTCNGSIGNGQTNHRTVDITTRNTPGTYECQQFLRGVV